MTHYELSYLRQPGQPPGGAPPPAGGGSLDVLSVTAGDLTWGAISGSSDKTITVTGDNSGDIATGSLAFSLNTDSFLITMVDGNPITNGSGTSGAWDPSVDGNFYFAMDNGQSTIFTFRPVYTDGTAKTMQVDVKRGDSTVDDTLNATVEFQDAFLGACLAEASCIALWSAQDSPLGDVDNGDVVMADISGNGEPGLQAVISSSLVWDIVSDSPPGAGSSLSRFVQTDERGTSNYAVLQSALSTTAESGCFLIRVPLGNWSTSTSWVSLTGTLGAPDPTGTEIRFMNDANNLFYGAAAGFQRAPMTHGDPTAWLMFSFRRSGGTTFLYASLVGGAWKALGSNTGTETWVAELGLRALYWGGGAGLTADNHRLGPIALFSTDIGEAGLQAIFENGLV